MASKTSIIKKQNNTKTNPIYKIASKVYNLNELLKKEVEKLLSSYDIGFAELDLLIVLHEADKKVFKPSDLYDKLQFSSGGITKIIKRLEIKHYIKKEVFLEDLRSKPISITKKGQSLVLELFPKVIHLVKVKVF
jgi:DNA-binding MarR family transcriptional regulator